MFGRFSFCSSSLCPHVYYTWLRPRDNVVTSWFIPSPDNFLIYWTALAFLQIGALGLRCWSRSGKYCKLSFILILNILSFNYFKQCKDLLFFSSVQFSFFQRLWITELIKWFLEIHDLQVDFFCLCSQQLLQKTVIIQDMAFLFILEYWLLFNMSYILTYTYSLL